MAKFKVRRAAGAAPRREEADHNHQKKLGRLIAEGKLRPVVGVTQITVKHDDPCAIWRGGVCDCDPDISVDGQKIA